ncbi:MAG: DNA polymerase III subunit beta [Planctomycetota bacterium]
MKILCDRQELQDAFAAVSGIPPVKSTKTVLQNVLLRAEPERVVFLATDNEMTARATLRSVKVSEPGSILLPCRETSALIRELSEPTVAIKASSDRCRIESGSGSFDLLSADVDQFPPEPKLQAEVELEVSMKDILQMYRRTSFACAKEETRYAINGVLIDFVDGCLRMVGTDGRRLALAYTNIATQAPRIRAVVPLRALNALTKAFADDSEAMLTIGIARSQIRFEAAGNLLVSQLLDNRFPDYEQVIPKAAETVIEVDRQELERNLRRVAVLASNDIRMVALEFADGNLDMRAESSSVGKAHLTMAVDMKGKPVKMGFNPDFLIEALRVSELDTIRIDVVDGSVPIKCALGESYSYILMPIGAS